MAVLYERLLMRAWMRLENIPADIRIRDDELREVTSCERTITMSSNRLLQNTTRSCEWLTWTTFHAVM